MEKRLLHYIKKKTRDDTPFTAVILDLTIKGGMGGKETLKNLRKIDNNVRALVTSGYSNDPIISDYRSYGFNGVIPKPFTIEEISFTLSSVISNEGL
jgi:two-component system cell cycle sensor histidine kinase/response regulator CckA